MGQSHGKITVIGSRRALFAWLLASLGMLAMFGGPAYAYQPPAECRGARAATSVDDLIAPPAGATALRIVKPLAIASTINVDVDLCFMHNGLLVIGAGASLHLNGQLYAGPWRIFDYQAESSAVIAPNVATVYPEWWGAVAGDAVNDTTALRHAGRFISDSGGGQIEFMQGTYIVGRQYRSTANAFPLLHEAILQIRHTTQPVVINGNGAKLVAAEGLYFGYFDPATGTPAVPPACGAGSPYAANAYTMINLEFNQDVVVRDFELDGNIFGLVLGEKCPDGRQLFGYGLRAYNNEQVHIENVYAHHNALDGIIIGYTGLTDSDTPKPHSITNVVSEYNARQGISWVGGNSLTINGCKSNHTGKARFGSPPGAGLDIEAEDAVIRNGLVTNCEFIDNSGPGIIADSGDGGYTTVRNSTLWGTTNWAVFPRKPGMVFEDSNIYGSVPNPYGSTDPAKATQFRRCTFEDLDYGARGVYRSGGALLELEGENVLIEDSTVIANNVRALWLDGGLTREIVKNVTVIHGDYDRINGDFQSLIRGSRLENVHFKEAFATAPDPDVIQGWYIAVEPNVTYTNVCVDGPWIRWGNRVSGPTGCPIP